MASGAIRVAGTENLGDFLLALVDAEGSRSHRWRNAPELLTGRNATRNLADVVHHLCTLHGRHPGVMDHAIVRADDRAARKWLIRAIDGFAIERAGLVAVAAAAGPLPGTPGQADSEAALQGQRHALDMLAQSDRAGCAIGAAVALALDWVAIREVLDAAATRLGLDMPPYTLPDERETVDLVASISGATAIDRAITFGARQLLAQQRGLWDLLEARHAAREQI